jgi:hypothetical protein
VIVQCSSIDIRDVMRVMVELVLVALLFALIVRVLRKKR